MKFKVGDKVKIKKVDGDLIAKVGCQTKKTRGQCNRCPIFLEKTLVVSQIDKDGKIRLDIGSVDRVVCLGVGKCYWWEQDVFEKVYRWIEL